jgi:hypothetical protein
MVVVVVVVAAVVVVVMVVVVAVAVVVVVGVVVVAYLRTARTVSAPVPVAALLGHHVAGACLSGAAYPCFHR